MDRRKIIVIIATIAATLLIGAIIAVVIVKRKEFFKSDIFDFTSISQIEGDKVARELAFNGAVRRTIPAGSHYPYTEPLYVKYEPNLDYKVSPSESLRDAPSEFRGNTGIFPLSQPKDIHDNPWINIGVVCSVDDPNVVYSLQKRLVYDSSKDTYDFRCGPWRCDTPLDRECPFEYRVVKPNMTIIGLKDPRHNQIVRIPDAFKVRLFRGYRY